MLACMSGLAAEFCLAKQPGITSPYSGQGLRGLVAARLELIAVFCRSLAREAFTRMRSATRYTALRLPSACFKRARHVGATGL